MERTEADFGKLCEKIGSFNWKELNLYLFQSRELFGFWHLFSGLISYCHYSINSLNYGQWTLSCFSVIFIIGKLRSTVHVFVHIFNLLYTGHFKLVLLLVHWMLSVVHEPINMWRLKYVCKYLRGTVKCLWILALLNLPREDYVMLLYRVY